jgi:transcription elongation factor GreB
MTTMSRAFVKESDEGPPGGDIPERHVSEHPNLVTPAGLTQLEARVGALEERRAKLLARADGDETKVGEELASIDRDLRYFWLRVETARPVDPAAQPHDEVAFGARVTVRDDTGATRTYAIVGEDEADLTRLKVSFVSPLAQALTGARVADEVTWRRPAGDQRLTVTAIDYGA